MQIDCPGIVPPNQQDTDEELLLRGSVRVENVEYPAQYVETVLKRVQPKHIQRTYEVQGFSDATSFLELLCRKQGRLLKGGEPDLDACARIVLNDWIRGKVPWFTPLPVKDAEGTGPVPGVDGREGRLGEMPRKRKRDVESEATESLAATMDINGAAKLDSSNDDGDDFEGFSDDGGLELDMEDKGDKDGVDESSGDEGSFDGNTPVPGSDVSDASDDVEDDEDVEGDLATISAALSTEKKRQRTE